jgi:hypothetical protein
MHTRAFTPRLSCLTGTPLDAGIVSREVVRVMNRVLNQRRLSHRLMPAQP